MVYDARKDLRKIAIRKGCAMPSLITHDTFGQDVYRDLFASIGGSRDEA